MLSQESSNHAVKQWIETLSDEEYLALRKAKKTIDWGQDWLFQLMGGNKRSDIGKDAYVYFLSWVEKHPIYLSLFLLPSFAYKNTATKKNHDNILNSSLDENILFLTVTDDPQGSDGTIEVKQVEFTRLRCNDEIDAETKIIDESVFCLEIGDVALSKILVNLTDGTPVCVIPYESELLKK